MGGDDRVLGLVEESLRGRASSFDGLGHRDDICVTVGETAIVMTSALSAHSIAYEIMFVLCQKCDYLRGEACKATTGEDERFACFISPFGFQLAAVPSFLSYETPAGKFNSKQMLSMGVFD